MPKINGGHLERANKQMAPRRQLVDMQLMDLCIHGPRWIDGAENNGRVRVARNVLLRIYSLTQVSFCPFSTQSVPRGPSIDTSDSAKVYFCGNFSPNPEETMAGSIQQVTAPSRPVKHPSEPRT